MTNPFNPDSLDWGTGLLAGWTYDKPVNKWFQGQFRHAHRLTRPCPTCQDTIVLDVTTKALMGDATNHGLSLRRCKACRVALKTSTGSDEYEKRKALGAERRTTASEEVLTSEQQEELERLRDWEARFYRVLSTVQTKIPNADMTTLVDAVKLIIDGADQLYANYQAQFEEIQVLKAQLAKYDLPAAMHEMQNKLPWDA